MSVQAISWVLDHSESELAARLVLLAIANHANAAGVDAFPSQSTIAREARINERTVRRAVDNLVELGELEVLPGRGQKGARGTTNAYRLRAFVDPQSRADNLPGSDGPRAGILSERAGNLSKMGGQDARRTVLEPSRTVGARREGPNPAAATARMERERRRRDGTGCQRCEETGVRQADDGSGMVDCECKL